ncbi:uncharacterized protein bora [Procambarus clarkii]|uniref:uncharacterized protein bora n=1 Tax=Procambarus clarkii TaxID=6728 RepID=UPI0037435D0F
MDLKSSEILHNGVDKNTTGKEEGGGQYMTPQHSRRPLQQIKLPLSSSPMSQSSLTPYRYHKCRVIQEETWNQENLDPRWIHRRSKKSHSGNKSQGTSSDETDESSPFAYPLIWESYQGTSSSLSHSPSSLKNTPPLDRVCCCDNQMCYLNDTGRLLCIKNIGQDYCNGKGTQNTRSNFYDDHVFEKSLDKEGNKVKKVRNCSGPSGESSSNKSQGQKCLTVTPSKSPINPSPSAYPVFRTPSERFSCTKSSESRGPQTPQHRHVFHQRCINPFEVGAECLQMPAVSPSLFRHVVSPSQKADGKFRWSIDQLALLHPANIETSPFNQAEMVIDPDYERKAQDAIDKFFTHESVVPSPWTGSGKSVNLLRMVCTPVQQTNYSAPHTNTVWCQTELTLPPILPKAVEEALKPFCTFTQDQWWQGSTENDEGTNVNNTTLRRKLLFSHDELLNVTPMCSPRGADASESRSPPSSPVEPLPLQKDDESTVEVKEEDEDQLQWCSNIVTSELIGRSGKDPQLARHPPPSPPSPSMCLPSPTVIQKTDCLTVMLHSDHDDSALPLLSPNLSPIENQENSMVTKQPRFLVSPDVSPITILPRGSDSNPASVCSSNSPFLDEILHGHHQPKTQSSPNVSPAHSSVELQSSASSPEKYSSHTISLINKSFQTTGPLTSNLPLTENYKRLHQELQISPKTCHSTCLHLCNHNTYSVGKLITKNVILKPETSKDDTGMLDVTGKGWHSESEAIACRGRNASTESLTTPPICRKHLKLVTVGRNCSCAIQDRAEELPDKNCDIKNCSNERLRKIENVFDFTREFIVAECDNPKRHGTPEKTSSKTEPKTSSNSGHFSSSPIRDALQSPLEVDTPNKRFSASPPLSPILCRSIMFQSRNNCKNSPRKRLQDNYMKTDDFSLLQSTFLCDGTEEANCTDEIMMEDGPIEGVLATKSLNPIVLTHLSTRAPLQRSSSISDMETDLHPSLEINGNDEGPSQDTGYQTGSLHATNFSITAYNQDNFTSSSVPQQHTEQPSRFVNSSCIQSNSSITKVLRNGCTISSGKETSE